MNMDTTKNVNRMTVLITGAAGGLGKAFAVECASRGWDLFLNDLQQVPLETLAAALRRSYGVQVVTHACDLTDAAEREGLFEHARAEGWHFSMLVNVAGVDFEGPFFDQSAKQIQTIVRLNVEGTLAMTHAILDYRKPDETLHIINVASLAAFLLADLLLPVLKAAPMGRVVTVSSDSHYGARLDWNDPQLRRRYDGLRAYGNTKLADVLFTLELNRRLGKGSHVHAFAVDPGLVKTDIGLKGTPALVQWVWKVRRSGGTPAEVPARCITYLLAEPSLQDSGEVYWKDCQPKRASREALDIASAERLWVLSEKLCGLDGKE